MLFFSGIILGIMRCLDGFEVKASADSRRTRETWLELDSHATAGR
jgi:hypothetical protein